MFEGMQLSRKLTYITVTATILVILCVSILFFRQTQLERSIAQHRPWGDIIVEAIEAEDVDTLRSYLVHSIPSEKRGHFTARQLDILNRPSWRVLQDSSDFRAITSGRREHLIDLNVAGASVDQVTLLPHTTLDWFSVVEDSQGRSIMSKGLTSPRPDIVVQFTNQITIADRARFVRHYQNVLEQTLAEHNFNFAAEIVRAQRSLTSRRYYSASDELRASLPPEQCVSLRFKQALFLYLAELQLHSEGQALNENVLSQVCNLMKEHAGITTNRDREHFLFRYGDVVPYEDAARTIRDALATRPALRYCRRPVR